MEQGIVSGGWELNNLETEYVQVSPDAPVRMLELTTRQRLVACRLPLNPVYVEDADGEDILHYREADMAMGRLYRFRWGGEEFAALRSRAGVEILKFVPEENDRHQVQGGAHGRELQDMLGSDDFPKAVRSSCQDH